MNQKAFTLVELISILVLIGILAAVAIPRWIDVPSANAGAFAAKLRADIRYAQNLAMTGGIRHRIYINTAPAPNPGYAVVNDANANSAWGEAGEIAQDPAGGGNLSVALNAGEYSGITISTPAGGYIEFNTLGAPTTGAVTLTVYGNAVAAGTVTVAAQTGTVN